MKGLSIVALIGAIFVIIIGAVVISYVTAYNLGNRSEKTIIAAHTDNKNVLSNYHAKIAEMVQVPSMYKDDFKEVVTGALSSRYGADGSKAMFQWIQEHAINYDSSLYGKIMQNMEAGRNKFEANQKILIDTKRVYETNLGSLWTGTWLRIAGYPKIDLSKYSIVVLGEVQDIFDSGVDKPIQIKR